MKNNNNNIFVRQTSIVTCYLHLNVTQNAKSSQNVKPRGRRDTAGPALPFRHTTRPNHMILNKSYS